MPELRELRELTNEELIRHAVFGNARLTILENELVHRLEDMMNAHPDYEFPQWVGELIEADEPTPDFLKGF